MELNLGSSAEIEVKAAETITTETVNVEYTVDNGASVEALVRFPNGTAKNLVLWSADTKPSYNEIGDWTEEDKNARIIQLLTA